MTPPEINKAIAEWMGWTHLERSGILIPDPPFRGYPSSGAIVGKKQEIPNYHGDLNACAEARSKLTEEQQWAYVECLGGMATHKNALWRLTNATAPQHCETLLRVLNLWKE